MTSTQGELVETPAGGIGSRLRDVEGTGSWLFRNRSWLPVPLALVLVLDRAGEVEATWLWWSGIGCVALGVALRMWAVRHIGVVSRTRASRLGPLVTTGPYAVVRNPLYVGNLFLWTGFVLCSEIVWMLPVAWCVFACQYGAIVRWEEHLLHRHRSASYEAYCLTVGRWRPRRDALTRMHRESLCYSWRSVVFSERGTLVAVSVMMVLLVAKELA